MDHNNSSLSKFTLSFLQHSKKFQTRRINTFLFHVITDRLVYLLFPYIHLIRKWEDSKNWQFCTLLSHVITSSQTCWITDSLLNYWLPLYCAIHLIRMCALFHWASKTALESETVLRSFVRCRAQQLRHSLDYLLFIVAMLLHRRNTFLSYFS